MDQFCWYNMLNFKEDKSNCLTLLHNKFILFNTNIWIYSSESNNLNECPNIFKARKYLEECLNIFDLKKSWIFGQMHIFVNRISNIFECPNIHYTPSTPQTLNPSTPSPSKAISDYLSFNMFSFKLCPTLQCNALQSIVGGKLPYQMHQEVILDIEESEPSKEEKIF